MAQRQPELFVGREHELARLKASLAEAETRRGLVVLLAGEPGIGKTTLAEQLVHQAASQGYSTLHGACFEGEYTPPFWLWTQVIRTALDSDQGQQALERLTTNQRLAIARVVPEMEFPEARQESNSPESELSQAQPHDEKGRFELYDSVTRFLIHASQLAPTLVWLDDLHWADASDLAFLEFASQQLASSRVMILGTYRDTDVTLANPLTRTLGLLTRSRRFDRIQLSGLSASDMTRLIESSATVALNPGDSARLVERAAGNPLFGREMARGITTQDGRFNTEGRLPEGIAEAIGRRMDNLDEAQLSVLQTAAVLGRDFSTEELQNSTEDPAAPTDSALEAAVQRGLIEELASAPGTYRFTHALIQQTLHDELSPTQLVQSHARIATNLQDQLGERAQLTSNQTSELARHFREGVLLLDIEQAIGYVLNAGVNALANYSFVEAADHFGWAASSMQDKSDSEERASVLERYAVSLLQSNMSEPQRGWDMLCEAVRMYIRIGLNEDVVRMASFPAVIGGMTGVVDLIEDAMKVAEPGTIERGWLLARYCVSLADAARADDAEAAFRETMQIAAEHQDDRLRARALVHGAQSRYRANDPELCAERGVEAIELAFEAGDPLGILRVIDFCVEALCSIGKTQEAIKVIERCRGVREEFARPFGHSIRAELVIVSARGEWDRIDALLSDMQDDERTANVVKWRAVHTGLRLGTPVTGNLESLDSSLSKWNIDGFHIAFNILSTWLQAQSEPELLSLCEQIRYDDPVVTAEGDIRLRSLAVLLALHHDQTPESDDLTALRDSPSNIVPRTDVPIDRILGAVAFAAGDHPEARKYFQAAIHFCRSAQFRPSLAWSLFDLVRLAAVSPSNISNDEVTAAAEEALSLCEEIQMPALADLIRQSVQEITNQSDGAADLPGGLSEREVEVLRLLARGMSNQEIADELFISRHTVVRHVSNIFAKSGTANRTEAASFAHQHGLT